jgi:hypothetical protein
MSNPAHILHQASQILGVHMDADYREIQYAFYTLMCTHHPDRNPDDPHAARRAALIIEARDALLGKVTTPVLLKDRGLLADVLERPLDGTEVLTYEQWLKNQFFDADQGSIWPG